TRQNDHPPLSEGYSLRWRFATHAWTFGLVWVCHTRTNLCGIFARYQHEALELGHQRPVLVEHAGVDLDRPAVRLRARFAHLEHLGLGEQRVAVEDRSGVAELLGRKVRDRLTRNVADAHAEGQRIDIRPDHDVAPLLGLRRVDVVDV